MEFSTTQEIHADLATVWAALGDPHLDVRKAAVLTLRTWPDDAADALRLAQLATKDTPDRLIGRIALNGRTLVDTAAGLCLPPEKRRIGYVFQDARLFPHYRVRGNLQYGMAAGMRAQFNTIVELLGIGPLLNRLPLTLSGGEKQRVAIGRALLTAPELLLMDEPLASLDLPRKRELLPYLERLAQDVNIPILYVSHSLDEILRLAEQVMVLDRGEVRAFVVEDGVERRLEYGIGHGEPPSGAVEAESLTLRVAPVAWSAQFLTSD